MKEQNIIDRLLDIMARPAFRVENGRISHMNPAAKDFFLEIGTEVAPLLLTGQQEFAELKEGSLALSICIHGTPTLVHVLCSQGLTVLLPDTQTNEALRNGALISTELRKTVADLMTASIQASPEKRITAQQNIHFYKILRILNNLTDAYTFTMPNMIHLQNMDVTIRIQELVDNLVETAKSKGVSVHFTNLPQALFTAVDDHMLERALNSMFSNAIKFAPPNPHIDINLNCRGHHLLISISSPVQDSQQVVFSNLFDRHLRAPSLTEDSRLGLGLGLVLVQHTANAHGGVVLTDQPDDNTFRITMSLAISSIKNSNLRSPRYGSFSDSGWDPLLMEFSDFLPVELYEPKK